MQPSVQKTLTFLLLDIVSLLVQPEILLTPEGGPSYFPAISINPVT